LALRSLNHPEIDPMTATPLHIHTPLYENPTLNARLNKRIYLKMECYQPIGSFKIRGIGALCQEAFNRGVTRLVASSGGNAGYAAAYAGRQLGVRVTVAVPESTSPMARARITAEGAELIVHGASWDETDTFAQQLAHEVGGAYIPPFDHPVIWQGNATVIDEIIGQCPTRPEAVIVSVGGGGLFCGVVEGMQRHGWADVPVLAAETHGADSLAASLTAGRRVTLPEITSIATTLGARTVAARAFELAEQHPTIPVVVSDAEAVDACLSFATDQRVIVEPACGAALALLYRRADVITPYASVLVMVCGGAGADLHQLLRWQAALA